ncbi:hypothetical protein SOPP22_02110 [Shewanella sp. OPT22]|nr:hypothetical protein SOPP22_02110 [Shewanella sp. OPT22]
MNQHKRKLITLSQLMCAVAIASALTACGSSHKHKSNKPMPLISGYLYTTTNGNGDENGNGMNKVMRLTRYADGTVGNEVVYDTKAKGAADVSTGGDAHGDFDSQGAIQIIGDYLLNVDAGSDHYISVFKIDKSNGDLTWLENIDSGGERPVSITYTKKPNSDDQYWVVVGNQWNNPNVQKDGTDIERYPSNDFFIDSNGDKVDLTASDPSDTHRNISLFNFDSSNGSLAAVGSTPLATYDRANGGPTTVTFSADGTKLAVSTWGIAHFNTDNPSTDEQHPSRVYVYDFDNSNGNINSQLPDYFEKTGIAGTIGINWALNSNTTLHASNFNLTSELIGHGLTVLNDDGNQQVGHTGVSLTAHYNTGAENTRDEACWTVLSPDGKRLYISSFGANVITPFTLNANGTVAKTLSYASRSEGTPAGDTKDMYITPDNKYLYVLGAFQTFTLNRFNIKDDGTLSYIDQHVYKETKDDVGKAGAHNFLGLAGFSVG